MSLNRRSLAAAFLESRRQFVLGTGAMSIVPWLGDFAQNAVAASPNFTSSPFQLGVASGDPLPGGFVIWTRLATDPLHGGGINPEVIPVRWEISEDETFKTTAMSGKTFATPQLGHSVHVEIDGLKPNRWYWYRFHCGDATSAIGRARTTPRPSQLVDQLRFAFCSCQHFEHGLFTAYGHMAQEELDLILFLGDYIYEYEGVDNRVRKHEGDEIASLDDYRNRLSQYRMDPNLQAAHARCPWLMVWDDHEFDNNYADAVSEEGGIDPQKFMIRRANAYQAYYEMMPLRRRSVPSGPFMQLFRQIQFGQLANFQMLDTRQYRGDQPNGDGLKELPTKEQYRSILGEKQRNWLKRNLIKSRGRWNVLGQQVMMAQAQLQYKGNAGFSMDQWPGYRFERDELLSFIDERKVPNPVVLTGDIHSNWVNDLKIDFSDEKAANVGTEFVTTSISSGGNGSEMESARESIQANNPFVKHFDALRGYVSCTVTPDHWQSDYQVVEFVDKPGAPLKTKASFVVENGKPGAQRVTD